MFLIRIGMAIQTSAPDTYYNTYNEIEKKL